MAEPKKLPSGSWRIRICYLDEKGKQVRKSFTAETKQEARHMADVFMTERKQNKKIENKTTKDSWGTGRRPCGWLQQSGRNNRSAWKAEKRQGFISAFCRAVQNTQSGYRHWKIQQTARSRNQEMLWEIIYNHKEKDLETQALFVCISDYKNVCSLLAITSSCCSRVRSINFTA